MSEPGDAAVAASLTAHVARAFADAPLREVEATSHVREALPGFKLLAIDTPGGPTSYVTLGAWTATRDEPEGLEFVLRSRREHPLLVDALSTAAYYHSFYGLDEGSVLKVGRGWLPDASGTRLLVLPPTFLPELERAEVGGRRVRFLWLFPITPDEQDFLEKRGLPALLERLAAVDPLDPGRASVA